MASHFKLKAIIDGQEEVAEEFNNLTGNKTINVFPVSKNNGTSTIRSSAVIQLSGKIHSVPLAHKGKSGDDPEPSSVKWSYIYPLYSVGSTMVSDDIVKSQDRAYVKASCGKTKEYQGQNYIEIICSKPYNTLYGLNETVGDFSGDVGKVTSSTTLTDIVHFRMYYKNIVDGIIPVDDDTPESNKARIPGKPSVSSVPNWITDSKLSYYIWTDGTEHTFDTWEAFIDYWDNTVVPSTEIVDADFSYVFWGKIQPNNSNLRSGTITFDEVSDGKGAGRHGIKPLYLNMYQQEGFVKYHLGSVPAPMSTLIEDGGRVFWSLTNPSDISEVFVSADDLAKYPLPEASNETYGDHCIFTPEFKIWNNLDYNRPASVWTEKGYTIRPFESNAGFENISHQYIGKPIVIGAFRETPNTFERVLLRPFKEFEYQSSGGGHGSFNPSDSGQVFYDGVDYYSLLGVQAFDPFKNNADNPSEIAFRDDIGGHHTADYSGRLLSGNINGRHWVFKLIPVSILTPEDLELSYPGNGVNEISSFNAGNSAVSSNDLVTRATYAEYYNKTSPDDNNPITLNGRQFEIDYFSGYDEDNAYWKKVSQILFIPVLYTDFYLEQENPFENMGSNVLGRLYFSIREPGSNTDASTLKQFVINVPSIVKRIG